MFFREGTTLKILCLTRCAVALVVASSPMAFFFISPAIFAAQDNPKQLLAQAERFEQQGDWGAAADRYEQLLRLDRNQVFVRDRYQYCLRRYFQVVRFRDSSYQKEVLSLKYP